MQRVQPLGKSLTGEKPSTAQKKASVSKCDMGAGICLLKHSISGSVDHVKDLDFPGAKASVVLSTG